MSEDPTTDPVDVAGESPQDGQDELDLEALSLEEIIEALKDTTTTLATVRLPVAINRSFRSREAEESQYPTANGEYIKVAAGELFSYVWLYFLNNHPGADGTIATWALQLREQQAALVEARRRKQAEIAASEDN